MMLEALINGRVIVGTVLVSTAVLLAATTLPRLRRNGARAEQVIAAPEVPTTPLDPPTRPQPTDSPIK